MSKSFDPSAMQGGLRPRVARRASGRTIPADGQTIAGGSQEPRLAVARWLQTASQADSATAGMARAVAGGVQKAAVGSAAGGTVALSDGTRITFNEAAPISELETA